MTSLAERKTRLVFETADTVFDGGSRQVVVEARPTYAIVRLKGRRSGYLISYAAIYSAAVKLAMQGQPKKKARR